MSIEEYGQSLLSDVRQRREQREREARKRQEKEAMLGLGISLAGKIGEQFMSRKTNEFLRSEPFLAKNLEFKQMNSYAAKDVSEYDSYLENPDFFTAQYVQKYTPAYKSYAGTMDSERSINERIAIDAQAFSERRVKEIEGRINEARAFLSLSGGDDNAYFNAVKASRDKNPIDAAVTSIGNFITGGDLNDSALQTELYSKSQDYKALYKQNPRTALGSVQMIEDLKKRGITFDEAPAQYEAPISIDVPDGFGGTKKESVMPIKKKGLFVGYQRQDGSVVNPYSKNQTRRSTNVLRAVPTLEQARQIQAQVNETITTDQQEALENIAVSNYGREAESKDKLEAGVRSMYGNLYTNAGMLSAQFGLSSRNSFTLAAEMEILRQQVIRGGTTSTRFKGDREMVVGLETETNADSVSPMLMLAAIDSLESKNVLGRSTVAYERMRTTAEQSLQGDNPFVKEFVQTFDSLDVRTQKDLIEWMEQYPSLTQQRQSGLSVVEQLQRKYTHLRSAKRDMSFTPFNQGRF